MLIFSSRCKLIYQCDQLENGKRWSSRVIETLEKISARNSGNGEVNGGEEWSYEEVIWISDPY